VSFVVRETDTEERCSKVDTAAVGVKHVEKGHGEPRVSLVASGTDSCPPSNRCPSRSGSTSLRRFVNGIPPYAHFFSSRFAPSRGRGFRTALPEDPLQRESASWNHGTGCLEGFSCDGGPGSAARTAA
jgi:hypothetical protein